MPIVVTPADACLDTGFISIGLIDIIVESTTPPVDGILLVGFVEMSNRVLSSRLCFLFLIYSETEEEEDL